MEEIDIEKLVPRKWKNREEKKMKSRMVGAKWRHDY
jgi:hypothetical protein